MYRTAILLCHVELFHPVLAPTHFTHWRCGDIIVGCRHAIQHVKADLQCFLQALQFRCPQPKGPSGVFRLTCEFQLIRADPIGDANEGVERVNQRLDAKKSGALSAKHTLYLGRHQHMR